MSPEIVRRDHSESAFLEACFRFFDLSACGPCTVLAREESMEAISHYEKTSSIR